LSRFYFILKYILKVRIEKVDRLSKKPDLKVEIENNNENQKLIKEEWIREMMEVVVKRSEIELVEKIKKVREKEKRSKNTIKSCIEQYRTDY